MQDRKQAIEEMLLQNPKDSFLNYAMAIEQEKVGNNLDAISTLKNLKNIDPQYLGLYLKLAQLYLEINNENDALAILREGITVAKFQKNKKAEGELNAVLLELED